MLNKSINKRSRTMRTYLYFFLFLSLLVVGCTEESNILSPVSNDNNIVVNSDEPNWIVSFPSNQSLKKDALVSQMVYGNQETLLEINTGWATSSPYYWLSITANARFQKDSFTGSRFITMTVNDQFGTATFTPSGTFSKPVIYNLTIVGVDLSKVDPAKVKFVYMAPNGQYYTPVYERMYVEKQSGKLQIVNAKLPHFSRYGFVN